MEITHTLHIDAPVERVWDLTLDVESWPATTPTIASVERLDHGPMRPGSTALVKQPLQRPKVWTVREVDPGRRFSWTARGFGTDMVATHVLEAAGSGTSNTLSVELRGSRAGLVGRLVGGQIRKALATENAGFKRAAET